jgi:hypothetical protein
MMHPNPAPVLAAADFTNFVEKVAMPDWVDTSLAFADGLYPDEHELHRQHAF